MGFLDGISKIKDLAGKATTAMAKTVSSEKEPALPDMTVENGITTINTLDGMSSYLQEMQGNQCSPSAMQALQSQMQVLSYVKTPLLTGMAVDTMVMCLYKAIQSAANETEKDAVRESFALMIQSFMFFNEAQLQYEINSNKEEGVQLLTQAGEVLSKSVVSVATLVVTSYASCGAALAVKAGSIVVKNVFAKQNGQQSFFGKLVSFIGDKKRIEERKMQYYDTLRNTFTLFDRYAAMIGTSIILHGMLDRYGHKLIEQYEEEKYKYLLVSIGKAPELDLDSAIDILFNPFSLINNTVNAFQKQNKKKKLTGYDYVLSLRDKAADKLNKCNSKEEKRAAQEELVLAEQAVEKATILNKEIDAYATKINAIVGKFAIDFLNVASLSSASFETSSPIMPPPAADPNQCMYNVSVSGQTTGPYSTVQLKEMIAQGRLNTNTYVWTRGMTDWEKAGNVEELSCLFGSIPPPPPII